MLLPLCSKTFKLINHETFKRRKTETYRIVHCTYRFTNRHRNTSKHLKQIKMKKLIIIVIIGLFMSSCSRYTNAGGGGCGVWMPKKYSGAAKPPRNWSSFYRSGVH